MGSNTAGQLRLLYWNPGGVTDKILPLRLLTQSQDIHIVLLGETKLRPEKVLKVPNYVVYRRDEISPRGQPYRGTAALVRRDIVHDELGHPLFEELRSVGVLVKTGGRETKIYAGYRPPGPRFLATDLRNIFDGTTPTVLVGDLNAKHHAWGSRVITPAGKRLLDEAEAGDLTVIGPDSPTHIPSNPHHSADVLDIVVHQNLCCPVHIEVLYDLDTQHLPILVTLALEVIAIPQKTLSTRTNWAAYATSMEYLPLGPLSTPEEVESSARLIMERMKAAKDAATTMSPIRTRRRPELPARLSQDINHKRALRRLWARTRCPVLKTRLNALTAQVSEAVKTWRGETWENVIDRSEHATDLHALNRVLQRTPIPTYPLLDDVGRKRFKPQDRAEILAEHLEKQFSPHPVPVAATDDIREHHQLVERTVLEFLSRPQTPLDGKVFISPAEVRKAALCLPRRKAPGSDETPTEALRNLPRRGCAALARLFNGILRTSYFPDVWKTGKVIMLPKPGKDRRLPSSYRPITLLPHIAKLFERLLLRRLTPCIEPRPEQFGFRSGHSTTLQLTRVLHLLTCELNKGNCTVGVFLDIEKAFDRVWHAGLIFKLIDTSTPPALVRLVASFLEGRNFYVSVEQALSQKRVINAGVPQGSCLSPALYGLYTDDIPTLAGSLHPWEKDVTLALYADDSAFFATSQGVDMAARRMQRVLDKLPVWLDKWRMAVNVGKTAALLVTRRRYKPEPLKLRGQEIEWQTSVKYLGVHIDRSLSMCLQAERVINETRAAGALLRPVLDSKLPLRTKIGVYKTYLRSRLTYAAPAWYALCSTTRRSRIQARQNIALRVCTGAGRYVRNDVIARDVGIPSVEEFVAKMARRMFDRADNGGHTSLHGIAPLHARPPDHQRTWLPTPRDLIRSPNQGDGVRSQNPQSC
ncbi:hypothetical protein K1T71_010056 [Dendrolimus kikuchii]|uniref:Uncharacterized protein n=1 Tax=Dendrolimus kikuchii TaxID=765133 RepID=A0ACC1CQP2_9NEOP|nr:hypothetical protein K1T71_010056 [Dendrolimus kikuchii]